ncbi:MAG: hypothetical protein ACI8TP_001619 [Acidimicrobiales bacterium]
MTSGEDDPYDWLVRRFAGSELPQMLENLRQLPQQRSWSVMRRIVLGAAAVIILGTLGYYSLVDDAFIERDVPVVAVLIACYLLVFKAVHSLANYERARKLEQPFTTDFLNSTLGALVLGLAAGAAVWLPLSWWAPRSAYEVTTSLILVAVLEQAEVMGVLLALLITAIFIRRQMAVVAVCAFTLGMATATTLIIIHRFEPLGVTVDFDGRSSELAVSHLWGFTLLSHALVNITCAALAMFVAVLGSGRLWHALISAR